MLKHMKIGKKLIMTFVSVALISSIAGIVGLIVMSNLDTNYNYALINYGFSQGTVGRFNAAFASSRSTSKDLMLYTDQQQIQTASDKLDATNLKINQYLTEMQKSMDSEKEMSCYNSIKEDFAKYTEIEHTFVQLAKQNKNSEAFTLMKNEGTPLSDKLQGTIDSLINLQTSAGNGLSSSLSSQAVTAKLTILIVILLSLIVSTLIALAIARSISKPIGEMAEAAERMSEGDLSVEVHVDSKNEIGQLAASFSKTIAYLKGCINDISVNLAKMAAGDLCVAHTMDYKGDFIGLQKSITGIVLSFNDALTQINQASQQVSSGSEQVANGAQALAQGATEQASSVEELSASITEISQHVKENAEHASSASTNVANVSSEIEISNKHMDDMLTAMSQINESSNEIAKIIKTIEDIAFQTNILALNAAVEAARAGSAGKGFAVVADEVRNLASKSAAAAKDTTSLIENSVKQVESGTKIADETAKSLLKVVDSAKAVSETIEKISEASNHQSDAIGQVTVGVEQISSVVQTNSATAQESAAASEELSGQAQSLKKLIQKFKLRDQNLQTKQKQQSENQTVQQQAEPVCVSSNSKY